MDANTVLKGIEEDLAAEFRHAHLRAHGAQFAGLFAAGFLASLAGAGFRVSGWQALTGLALGAAGAAVRQMWPQVPWATVLGVVRDARAVENPVVPPAASPHG